MNTVKKGKLTDVFVSATCALLFGLAVALITVIFDVYTRSLGITITLVSLLVGSVVFGLLKLGNFALIALLRDEVEKL